MNSKETQLSLSFCGALAAVLFMSAPVSQTIALAGSGTAFVISVFCFYGGISKYFSDKEKQIQDAVQQSFQLQNRSDEKFKEITDTIANLEYSITNPLNSISETLTNMLSEIKQLNITANNIEDNGGKINDLHKTAKEIFEKIEALAESVENISELKGNLQELTEAINRQEQFYKTTLNQCNAMNQKDVELIENLAKKLR